MEGGLVVEDPQRTLAGYHALPLAKIEPSPVF